MVAIHIAYTAPINPPGAMPILTHAQAWAGLARKVKRPQDFVPAIESSEILSEADGVVSYVAYFKPGLPLGHGQTIKGTCWLSPPCRLHYEMEDGSTSDNIISVGPGRSGDAAPELFLTFVYGWEHPELEAGSAEAKEAEEMHTQVGLIQTEHT